MLQNILKAYLKKFEDPEEDDITYYEAVQQTFDAHPKNIEKLDVALKFAVLNELYSTNIMDTYSMINHIHKLATKEKLDTLLKSGKPAAVNKIRQGHGIRFKKGKDYDFYSFATKYCHFSNTKCYPLYDQYVERALMKLRKTDNVQFKTEELYEPKTFMGIIDTIKQKFSLADYQQADRALWKYGEQLTNLKNKK